MEKNSYSLQRNTGLIGRYVIQEVLGQGGFGITYLGIDKLYGNKVAIKEYYPQEIAMRKAQYEDVVTVTSIEEKNNYDKGKKRFLDEAQVMARFNKNEGIVKILDFFEANNTAYIVMEYLEGITLKQYLGKYGVIQFRNLIEMMLPLLEALIEIHSQGLIHRDISPDNIMVQHNSKLKLMDFGAARDYTESGNKSLTVILKPGYAPPEQYQTHGVQGPWTDIYALCATIYKCLTGITPPDAIARVMDDKFKEPDQLDGKLSPDIKKILWKGMNGIAALHRAGIIHCGIKPDRVIILNDSTMKLLLDTGTLRKISIKDTSLPVIFDQHYAPLEVYSTKGELGPWTDIYALCATIYYYLSGDNPVEVIERISGKKLKNLSEYNTSVFPELENVILKGMSVDIKDRYQSMEEFCEVLYGVANEIRGFN